MPGPLGAPPPGRARAGGRARGRGARTPGARWGSRGGGARGLAPRGSGSAPIGPRGPPPPAYNPRAPPRSPAPRREGEGVHRGPATSHESSCGLMRSSRGRSQAPLRPRRVAEARVHAEGPRDDEGDVHGATVTVGPVGGLHTLWTPWYGPPLPRPDKLAAPRPDKHRRPSRRARPGPPGSRPAAEGPRGGACFPEGGPGLRGRAPPRPRARARPPKPLPESPRALSMALSRPRSGPSGRS